MNSSSWFDPRNVIDKYKGWSEDAIRQDLKDNSNGGAVCFYNPTGDFNFASVVRNANAFGFRDVFYISPKKKWDKRGAVGTYHYTNVVWCETVDMFWELSSSYCPVALENNINYELVSVYDIKWPDNPVIVIGEEQNGLPNTVLDGCKVIATIPQYGSVRSINAAVASGIGMAYYAGFQAHKGLIFPSPK